MLKRIKVCEKCQHIASIPEVDFHKPITLPPECVCELVWMDDDEEESCLEKEEVPDNCPYKLEHVILGAGNET